MNTIQNGKATYTVEKAPTKTELYYLTGARGATYMAAAYTNAPDVFHAWSIGGKDLTDSTGRSWRIARADIEAAAN